MIEIVSLGRFIFSCEILRQFYNGAFKNEKKMQNDKSYENRSCAILRILSFPNRGLPLRVLMGVKKISVRIHRPRSGRFADVPASLPRFCARIKEPAVGSKVLQNEEIRKKNHRSRCRRMLRRENSGPCFAKKKHRFHCRPVLRRKKKGQTGADVLSKVEKRSKIGNRRSIGP